MNKFSMDSYDKNFMEPTKMTVDSEEVNQNIVMRDYSKETKDDSQDPDVNFDNWDVEDGKEDVGRHTAYG
jgi:hypothetical protein